MKVNNKVVFLSAAVLVGFAVLILNSARRTSSQTQEPLNDNKKMVDAIRRGGLKEAAKLKRHYIATEDPNWDWANFNLEQLTKTSVAVIVGVPQTSVVQLSPTGDKITTNYKVEVENVIKGHLVASDIVEVSMLGGRMEFEDGTSAEIQTPGFERMQNGKRYILFLYANRNGSEIFLLTGGPQGLFELGSDAKVKPHARPTDHVVKEIEHKNIDSVLREIRMYAERWPNSSGCCN